MRNLRWVGIACLVAGWVVVGVGFVLTDRLVSHVGAGISAVANDSGDWRAPFAKPAAKPCNKWGVQ